MAKAAACACETVPRVKPSMKAAISALLSSWPSRLRAMTSWGRKTMGCFLSRGRARRGTGSGSVRNPDVLDLGGLGQKIVTLETTVGQIELKATGGPCLLEIADRGLFHHCRRVGAADKPQAVHTIMLGQGLGQRHAIAGDDIDHAIGHIGGFDDLIEIGQRERRRA